jgi:hypothetical protein
MSRLHGASTAAEVQDRGITTRPSSTANFYVDSEDKNIGQSSGDFLINKKQSLFNGFFHRIAVSEVLMDWGLPNVADWWGNNTVTVVNGGTAVTLNAKIPDGFYTAIQVLGQVALAVNAAAVVAGDPLRLSVEFDGVDVALESTGAGNDPFYFVWVDGTDPTYSLARQLFTSAQLAGVVVQDTRIVCASPRVLGTTYVDIVSPQLTYNQDLKDATTSDTTRDVIYRWYFAYDNVPMVREQIMNVYAAAAPAPAVQALAETNLAVLEGYNAFVHRRALPYPKQIAWNSEQPIGQVAFQCYDDRGRLINTANFPWVNGFGGANFQFQLSMLLSEN